MIRIARSGPKWWSVGLTLACGLLLPGMPLAIGADGGFPAWSLIVTAIVGVPWLYLVVRGARTAFTADEHGIVIANFLRTNRLAWSELAEVFTGMGSSAWQTGSGHIAVIAVAKDGRRIIANATTTRASKLEQLVSELAPVVEFAEQHGVKWEWRNLDAAQLEAIRKLVDAVQKTTSLAKHVH